MFVKPTKIFWTYISTILYIYFHFSKLRVYSPLLAYFLFNTLSSIQNIIHDCILRLMYVCISLAQILTNIDGFIWFSFIRFCRYFIRSWRASNSIALCVSTIRYYSFFFLTCIKYKNDFMIFFTANTLPSFPLTMLSVRNSVARGRLTPDRFLPHSNAIVTLAPTDTLYGPHARLIPFYIALNTMD